MSINRHRLLSEIGADIKARIAGDCAEHSAEVHDAVVATDLAQVIERVQHLTRFPAVLIVPTGGHYDPKSAWRWRDDRATILVVGEWQAAREGEDTGVWDLADAIVRCFLPGHADGDVVPSSGGRQCGGTACAVELEGVLYHPASLAPAALVPGRTTLSVVLELVNPILSRSDV